MKTLLSAALLAFSHSAAAAADDGWQALWNGRDLSGWQIACADSDRAKNHWRVRDGAIECDTAGDKNHGAVWLVSEAEFGDFEFRCVIESFAGSSGNSGVQIRSRFEHAANGGGRMHGPQVDIHPPSPWRCGLLYDETAETSRWISPPLPDWRVERDQGAPDVPWRHRDGAAGAPQANTLRVVARGTRIETFVNDVPVARFEGAGILDDAAHRRRGVGLSGHIALQLHGGDDLRIRFRDLRLRPLPPPEEPSPVLLARDDAGLDRALSALRPGSVLRIAPGTYRPGRRVADLHAAAGRPTVIEALDPRQPPLFAGGSQAWHLSKVSHLEMRWLTFRGQAHNGLNLDDGGDLAKPSHDIRLAHLRVEDVGPEGNCDGIKCSGVERLVISRCEVNGWGGQAIDFVGVRHAEIAHCRIIGKPGFSQHTGPQFKGGSSDVHIHDCLLENAGLRPIHAGGSTGLEYFRPPDAPYEAARILVTRNIIRGGQCAVAFTGAIDCRFSGNTIIGPEKWILRILQETTGPRFQPCGRTDFSDNKILFDRSSVRAEVNIGPGVDAAGFRFTGNRWLARDAPERSHPKLPSPEENGVYGQTELLEKAETLKN